MKYIRKMQSGGGLMDYMPNQIAPPMSQTQAASSGAAKATSILDSEPMKKLIQNRGLTNDVNAYVEQLKAIEEGTSNPYAKQSSRNELLDIVAKANELVRSKDNLEAARDKAQSNGGLTEVAVGDRGQLYIKDENKRVREISVSEYTKSGGKYTALSVASLLHERETNPYLVGQDGLLAVATNAEGLKDISETAQKFVARLGEESSKSEEYYSKSQAAEMMQELGQSVNGRQPTSSEMRGMKILKEVMESPTQYSKVMIEDGSQRNHAMTAVNYIWTNLDKNKQNKLAAQAAINGQSAQQLLLDMAIIQRGERSSYAVTPVEDPSLKGKGSGADPLTGAKHMTPVQTLLSSTFATGESNFAFNDPEAATQFNGLVLGSMALTGADGSTLPPTTLYNVVKGGRWEELIKMHEVYFGNAKVGIHNMDKVIIDGGSDIGHVYLPVNNDGSPDNGSLKIYRNIMDKYNDIKDTASRGEITQLFREGGFEVTINDDNSIDARAVGSDVKPFLITWGYTNSAVGDLVDGNDDPEIGGARRLSRTDNNNLDKIRRTAWTVGTGKDAKFDQPSSILKSERLYKSMIYMALKDNASVRADQIANSGPVKPKYEAESVMGYNQHSSNKPFVSQNINASNINNQ